MVAHLRKEKFEEKIDTGAKLVTPENLSQPEFKELLHPDLDRWLK
jgi:ribose transport system substrate-binding protein